MYFQKKLYLYSLLCSKNAFILMFVNLQVMIMFRLNIRYLSVFCAVSLFCFFVLLTKHTFTSGYVVWLEYNWPGLSTFLQLLICQNSGERKTRQFVQIIFTCWAALPFIALPISEKFKPSEPCQCLSSFVPPCSGVHTHTPQKG